jgi:hypothetical protein
MKEQLITFQTAKLAKEKGFDEIVDKIYMTNHTVEVLFENINTLKHSDGNNPFVSAPTQSLLQKWLRDIHNIQINIENYHSIKEEKPYSVYVEYMNNGHWTYKDFDEINDYNTYEEALEKGLQEGLKLINIEII